MPARVALYARVSTSEQHVEPQLPPLRRYAAARSLEVVEEYVDHGISGGNVRRPATDRLTADARRRGVKLGRRHSLDDVPRQRLARLVASGIPQRRIAELLGVSKGTVGREVAQLRERQQRRVA